jgi:hypothetical protein
MNKKQIRLTESDLKQIVKESVNKILSEAYGTMPNNDAYDITGLDAANDEGARFSPLGKFNDVPLDSLIDLNKAVKLFNNDYNYLQFINPNYAKALRKHLYYVDEYLDKLIKIAKMKKGQQPDLGYDSRHGTNKYRRDIDSNGRGYGFSVDRKNMNI